MATHGKGKGSTTCTAFDLRVWYVNPVKDFTAIIQDVGRAFGYGARPHCWQRKHIISVLVITRGRTLEHATRQSMDVDGYGDGFRYLPQVAVQPASKDGREKGRSSWAELFVPQDMQNS